MLGSERSRGRAEVDREAHDDAREVQHENITAGETESEV